jgi:glycosyltransferase involved in cell wall biosynthesis
MILPSLRHAGPVNVAFDLVSLLVQHGHQCTVLYFDEYADHVHQFPCEVRRILMSRGEDWSLYDVVHSHGFRPDAYVFLHKPWLHRCKTRFVSTLHNFVMNDLTADYGRMKALVYGNLWMLWVKRHDALVVLSRTAKEYYRHWHSAERMHIVYNTRIVDLESALSDEERSELERFKGNSPFLGVNCYLTPIKGIDLILRAMPFIKEVKLWIVGQGPAQAALEQQVREQDLSDRVYFAGFRADAYRYLPYYDLFLMPSRSEGFPLAMLEAAAFRRNIVCSDIPIFKEIFTDDELTFFHMEDPMSLAEAIRSALQTQKGEAIYARYQREYTPELFYQRYLEVYTLAN